MDTKEITVKEAIRSLNVCAMTFIETGEIDTESLSVFAPAVADAGLVRDFYMSAVDDFGLKHMTEMTEKIIPLLEPNQRTDFHASLACFYYEAGRLKDVIGQTFSALEIDDEHNLTMLILVLLSREWAPESWATQRAEIRTRVLSAVDACADMPAISSE